MQQDSSSQSSKVILDSKALSSKVIVINDGRSKYNLIFCGGKIVSVIKFTARWNIQIFFRRRLVRNEFFILRPRLAIAALTSNTTITISMLFLTYII